MSLFLKKSLLLISTLSLPAVALTACAGNSQYGTVAYVGYSYTDTSSTSSPTSSQTNDFVDLKNSKFGFNNLGGGTDVTYKYENSSWKNYSSKGYVKSLSQIAVTTGLLVQSLVSASLVGFTPNQTNNSIFNKNPQENEQFLQFLYAASNLLNSGEANQIGFGLKGIDLTIDKNIAPKKDKNVQVVKKENRQLGYTSDASLTFAFTFGYWWSGNDNPTSNTGINADQIKDYVENRNGWSRKFNQYYTTFKINLNLKARLQAVFAVSDAWAKLSDNHQAIDNWKNNEYLKDKNGTNNYSLTEDDITNQFVTSGHKLTFSTFDIQYQTTVTGQSSSFLDLFKAYDTTTPFGQTKNDTNPNQGTFNALSAQYSKLSSIFSSSNPNFSDFSNSLTFSSAQ
ncbi:MAG: hypothetical protein K2I67_00160 [Malacoplasma sp.]|nr:hypothetical protein [Malacoplasma sp.]